MDSETTYRIERKYRDSSDSETIAEGLTLEEAQDHCNDPETSSSTATTTEATERSAQRGPWFDCYYKED